MDQLCDSSQKTYLWRESNPQLRIRNPVVYPLAYRGDSLSTTTLTRRREGDFRLALLPGLPRLWLGLLLISLLSLFCGGREIRTPGLEKDPDGGFRNRCTKPLCDPSHFFLVLSRRFELPTSTSATLRSIQLSYESLLRLK